MIRELRDDSTDFDVEDQLRPCALDIETWCRWFCQSDRSGHALCPSCARTETSFEADLDHNLSGVEFRQSSPRRFTPLPFPKMLRTEEVKIRIRKSKGSRRWRSLRQRGRDVHVEFAGFADAALHPGLRVRVTKVRRTADHRGVGCGGRTMPHQAEHGATAPLRSAEPSPLWRYCPPLHHVRRDLRGRMDAPVAIDWR